jgi:nickel-dependent lactate racemase
MLDAGCLNQGKLPSGSEQLASRIETHLVKALHPLDEIAARIAAADGEGVYLTHVSDDAARDGGASPLDPAEEVKRALAEPLEFPPITAGIVPGDRVAIAVDSRAPCVAEVVRGAVETLMEAGVEPQGISVVTTDSLTDQACRDALPTLESGPQFVVHDPADENNLCLVGTLKRGEPLLINRAIFDADIVLPIGCARVNLQGAYESVFPRFSSAETLAKYRTPSHHDRAKERASTRKEIDEAGWRIGVLMTVQVVPGRGETVAQVLAGEPQAVARRSEELCRQRWSLHSPQRVSLMIATVTGGARAQTWENVGHALATAEELVDDGGAIAICSNLEEPLGESLGRLIGSGDLDRAIRKISHEAGVDSWPAWLLGRALQRGPVYFLSQLNAETVEDLGLAPVENVDDLVRLAGRHESFAVVEDSQHAVVTVDGANDEQ